MVIKSQDSTFCSAMGNTSLHSMNREGTLHYLLRKPPRREVVRLLYKDYGVTLGELKAPDEYATIIAIEPLTDEE